jgi:hypothetical protein
MRFAFVMSITLTVEEGRRVKQQQWMVRRNLCVMDRLGHSGDWMATPAGLMHRGTDRLTAHHTQGRRLLLLVAL